MLAAHKFDSLKASRFQSARCNGMIYEENRTLLASYTYEVGTQQSRYAATSVARKEHSRSGNENAIMLFASAQILAIV